MPGVPDPLYVQARQALLDATGPAEYRSKQAAGCAARYHACRRICPITPGYGSRCLRRSGYDGCMKISVSLPEDDVEFLDGYVRSQGVGSRSAVVRKAVGLLRASELGSAYEEAWQEWFDSGEATAWETAVGDGIA